MAACHYRNDTAGRIGLMLLLSLAFSAALWGLHIASGVKGDLAGIALAAAVTWTGLGLALVPLACGLGCAVHVLGDLCTKDGCMLGYPFSQHHFHLLPGRLAFRTGTDPETMVVRPGFVGGHRHTGGMGHRPVSGQDGVGVRRAPGRQAVTLPISLTSTRSQVERAVRRRLWLRFGLGQDAVDAVMGIVGPVIEAQSREIARLRAERVGGSAT